MVWLRQSTFRSAPNVGQRSKRFITKLPLRPVRTRFAPSPTGSLHLGSLRTALFNYLLARRTGGQFLLRIEDTDSKRTIQGAERQLLEDLRWAGLQWDEGPDIGGSYGPYRQSDRTPVYQVYGHRLIQSQHAYRCFCTVERLSHLAQQRSKLGLPPDYDRSCFHLSAAEVADRVAKQAPYVIRLKAPQQYPAFKDLVYGKIHPHKSSTPISETFFGDPVLIKSDGSPTYHLANVVDDHLMEITHVVRAVEWLPSTHKHVHLYSAFGWESPQFVHVGLLTDTMGRKLSKRSMDVDLATFRKDGLLPESLVNFVALLGWSHTREDDVMDMDDLIRNFDLKLTKGNTIVTPQKLRFLQRAHAEMIALRADNRLERIVKDIVAVVKVQIPLAILRKDDSLARITTQLFKLEARNFIDARTFVNRYHYFYENDLKLPPTTRLEASIPSPVLDRIGRAVSEIQGISLSNWHHSELEAFISKVVAFLAVEDASVGHLNIESTADLKPSRTHLNQYLRWALCSAKPGPAILDTLLILGPNESKERIARAGKSLRRLDQPA